MHWVFSLCIVANTHTASSPHHLWEARVGPQVTPHGALVPGVSEGFEAIPTHLVRQGAVDLQPRSTLGSCGT